MTVRQPAAHRAQDDTPPRARPLAGRAAAHRSGGPGRHDVDGAVAPGRRRVLAQAAARGAVGGLAGAAAMAAGQALERRATGRPVSHVSGRTLLVLLGRNPGEDDRPFVATAVMDLGTATALGALRGVWRATGLVAVRADVVQTLSRVIVDQTLQNATGAGAPPRTWARGEGVVEVLHAAVAAIATGFVTERLVQPVLESRRGTTSH